MREDPFIFRHDKRREAWGQYRAFLPGGAEYRLCRGNLLAQLEIASSAKALLAMTILN